MNPGIPQIATRAHGPSSSIAEVRLRERIEAFEGAVVRTRAGEDREAIHDLRVASRRLDAFLRTWHDLLPAEDIRPAVRDLRRVRRRIGRARDLDVQLGLLRERIKGHGTPDEQAMGLVRELEARLERRRRRAADRMRSKRSRRLLALLARLEQGVRRDLISQLQAFERAHERETKVRQAVIEALGESLAAEDDARLHEARLAIKKWRYTVESLGEGAAREVGVTLEQMRELQESLGAIQDRATLHRMLSRHLDGLGPGRANGTVAALRDGLESERRQQLERFRSLGAAFLRTLHGMPAGLTLLSPARSVE